MARRYYFLTTLENFDAVFEPINIIIYHFIHQPVCISIILTIFAARKERRFLKRPECGEIWLLATTLKNAKILTIGHMPW